MRILVTGGAGQLARALSYYVDGTGFHLTPFDARGGDGVLRGDIRDRDAIRDALVGHDAVVHAAALHGVHLTHHQPHEFLRVNVEGTDNVLRAAKAAGVPQVVLLSSMSVYGLSTSVPYNRTRWVNESTERRPRDDNDLCKVLCEELASYAVRRYGLSVTVLRPGRFFVDDVVTFNLAKLSGSVSAVDVAQGVIRALICDGGGFRVFCIASRTRFQLLDLPYLSCGARGVIEQRYPGATRALARHGRCLPDRLHRVVDIAKAQDELDYRPTENFEGFVHATLLDSDALTAADHPRSDVRGGE